MDTIKKAKGRPVLYENDDERQSINKENRKKARLRYYYRHTVKKDMFAKYQEWLLSQQTPIATN